jgi:hypothetical protein
MSIERVGRSDVAEAILKQLKDPFNPTLVKRTTLGGNKVVAYVDARDIMKRLDVVMGPENWQDKYIRTDGGFICELSLRIENEWITKSNGSNDTKIAAQKGGISGAFKRAAVNWGVGRYLYYFDPLKWTDKNVDNWPKIFKPGAPEDWENVAELEYGLVEGMDEEEVAKTIVSAMTSIQGAETAKELKAIVEKMGADEQRILADAISNKTQELLGGDTDTTEA